jgi:hypothetical protein
LNIESPLPLEWYAGLVLPSSWRNLQAKLCHVENAYAAIALKSKIGKTGFGGGGSPIE